MSIKSTGEVLVVGGGIGGMATALALGNRGFKVRVLEKAPEFGEIGFGIQLGPNAYRVLAHLGVVREVEQTAVFPDNLILIDALNDREIARINTGAAFRERYGAPYMVVHRRDLHDPMVNACRRHENVTLHTSKELTGFREEGGRVQVSCADGSQYEGIALVGADGLWSRVREGVRGDGPPRVAGHVVYRGVVPVDQIKDKSHFNDMVIWCGPNLHLVQYRLRGGTVMNNVATVVSRRFEAGERKNFGGPDELEETFARTTDHVREMLSYVGKDKNWVLHDREPVPNWTRGNVTLLGDAAHPTLQYLAQGAVMAMEDATVLGKKLDEAGSDINGAFVAYQGERYLRSARVVLTARMFGDILHCDGASRDLRNYLVRDRSADSTWEIDWLYRGIEL